MNAFILGLMLVLPIAALASRRLPIATITKMALTWIAIFTLLMLAVVIWQRSVA